MKLANQWSFRRQAFRKRGGRGDLGFDVQIPLPEKLNEGELLVRMEATGRLRVGSCVTAQADCLERAQVATICGSDLHTAQSLEVSCGLGGSQVDSL